MNEEHKFIYRIVCEPKITNNDKLLDGNFVSNLVTNMATMRLRAIDDSIISNLREIGREKNIDLLIGIDESKIMNIVNDLEVLAIIEKKNVAITMIKQTHSVTEYNMFANDFFQIKRVDSEKYKLSPQPLEETEFNKIKEWEKRLHRE